MKLSAKTALLSIFCLIGIGVNAQNSGACGTNATWEYDPETKTLTISGSGPMTDYEYEYESRLCPWKSIEDLQTVVIENGITTVGKCAFYNCKSIQTVTIPASVTSIGIYAFEGCSSMQSVTFAENINLTSIEEEVFYGCSSLTSVTLPNSVKSLAYRSFASCKNLKSVFLPSGLTSIGSSSFENCHALESVNIPASVTSIGGTAFKDCHALTAVYVNWSDPIEINKQTFKNANNADLTLYMLKGNTDAYKKFNWIAYNKDDYASYKYTDGFGNFVEVNVDYVDNAGQTHYLGATPGGTLPISDAVQSITSSEEVNGVVINYTRTFSSTSVWQAWYMPFEAVYNETLAEKCDVAQILGVFMDAAGNSYITFQPIASGTTIKANTPYVVRPKTSGEVTLTIENANLKQTQGTPFTIQSSTQEFTFGGVYEKTVNGSNGWYAINTEGSFQALDTDVCLKPMRIWMTIADRNDNPYAAPAQQAPQRIGIRILGEDSTTGIGFTESDVQGGEVFNLSERIVIINGKKYLR